MMEAVCTSETLVYKTTQLNIPEGSNLRTLYITTYSTYKNNHASYQGVPDMWKLITVQKWDKKSSTHERLDLDGDDMTTE
jgi:hypothetical protein